jgi:hypothetical protein
MHEEILSIMRVRLHREQAFFLASFRRFGLFGQRFFMPSLNSSAARSGVRKTVLY